MICMELGRSRSSTQVPGTISGGRRERSVVSSGMRWPAWNTFAAGDTLLDGRVIAPNDTKKFLIKRAKLLRWKNKQIDAMENGVWFEPIRTSRRKYEREWTSAENNRARHCVTDGAVTEDAMCEYGWFQKNGCKFCRAWNV